jgi:gluconolactonase
MYFDQPPRIVQTSIFTTMPDEFRRKGVASAWADANKRGVPVDSFIEGPAFDGAGRLYIVDIPFGRIFRISPLGEWTCVVEYDGEPNGLKLLSDGRILVADYRNGLVVLDPVAGSVTPLLNRRNSESFKGVNDLTIPSSGDIYFTDQGQTGLHDPTGRVYRLSTDGRLDCLLSNVPSPNGLVLSPDETVLFVAATRDNAVWRVPLMRDGSVAKVGRFCTMFGTSRPDGLAMDEAGRLFVAHASLGRVFVFDRTGECVAIVKSCAGVTCTNIAFGGLDRRRLFVTESETGSVMIADMDVPGLALHRGGEK